MYWLQYARQWISEAKNLYQEKYLIMITGYSVIETHNKNDIW